MNVANLCRRSSFCGSRFEVENGWQLPVGADPERLVVRAEEAAAGVAVAENLDEVRQVGPSAALILGHDRADFGKADVGAGLVAGVHQVDAAGMIDLAGLHRADDGDLVHLLRHLRHQLANLRAGDVGRDRPEQPAGRPAGLHVEGFELAGPAVHEQVDAVLFRPQHFVGQGRLREAAPVHHHAAAGGA